jgi:predicted cupin superfamily sugar epimerase
MELDALIKMLNLAPLPEEGGYFSETFRSRYTVKVNYDGQEVERKASTCIYYLVTPDDFSALHKVKGEEIFHFYYGDPIEMIHLTEDGPRKIIIGNRLERGEVPQVIVPSGTWQGTKLCEGGQYALLGCSVSPGFEYEDFTIAGREELISLYPKCRMDIIRYTRF